MQLTKAYAAKTSCNQLLLILLRISSQSVWPTVKDGVIKITKIKDLPSNDVVKAHCYIRCRYRANSLLKLLGKSFVQVTHCLAKERHNTQLVSASLSGFIHL